MSASAQVHTDSLLDQDRHRNASVIVFSEGLVGQPDWRRFVLLKEDDEDVVGILQSLEDEMLGLMVTQPTLVVPDYEVRLSAADRAALDLRTDQQPLLLTTVSVHGDLITTNLVGPLVINPQTLVGKQVVLSDSGYSTAHPVGTVAEQE